MKKTLLIIIGIIVLAGIVYIFIPGDTENRFARLSVSIFDGDYVITHYGMSGVNVWLVKDGKVTSEPDKGYYHARVLTPNGKTAYLQVPMDNTDIEEYKVFAQLTSLQKEILQAKYGDVQTIYDKKK